MGGERGARGMVGAEGATGDLVLRVPVGLWVMPSIGALRRRVSGGRAVLGGVGQAAGGAAPFFGSGAGRGHGNPDATDGDADQRPDLQELEPDGAAGGVRKGGFGKADAPQRADQHIGHRSEPQAQLVGAHGGRRGAIGIKVELAFLDAVLHVAAGAVDVLVELPRSRLSALERGDDEARIGLALRPLRLGDDAAPAAPAVGACSIGSP